MEFISLLKMAILNSLAAGVATKHPMGGIYRSSRSNIGRTPTLLCTLSYARAGSISIHEIHGVFYIVSMPRSSRSKSKSAHTGASSTTKVRLISSRTVYRGPAFWVTTDEVQEPGGVRARRDIVHHTGSVVVLAVDESRSLPGRIDPGEKPLPAAQRELLEETGYTAENWRRIFHFYASPGFVAETMSVYLATGLRAGKAQPEEDEVIQKRLVPLSTALGMVLRGTIRDAKTISSVLWLDHHVTNRRSLTSKSPHRRPVP
jgi:ADP-ribose pyrophosphatase